METIRKIMSFTLADWNAQVGYHFEAGKRASDFVGMILRSAFCLGAVFFLMQQAAKEAFPYNVALALSAIFPFFMYIYIGSSILAISVTYLLRLIARFANPFVKVIAIIGVLIAISFFAYGEFVLVQSLAKSATFKSSG